MRIKDMRLLCERLEELGFGDGYLDAEHDEVFMPGPNPETDPDDALTLGDAVDWSEEHGCWRAFT